MLDRRGKEWPFSAVWTTLGIFVLLLVGIFGVLMPAADNYLVLTYFSVNELDFDITASRAIESPECLAFEDELGTHAGIIEPSKLNLIESCTKKKDIHMALYELDSYGSSDPIAKSDKELPDDVEYITHKYLVRYIDANKDEKSGILEVYMW